MSFHYVITTSSCTFSCSTYCLKLVSFWHHTHVNLYIVYYRSTLHGSVDIAADKDYSQYAYSTVQDCVIKDKEKDEEIEHKIPGNTAHYKVILTQQDEKSKCLSWSFRVTGLQMGRCGMWLPWLPMSLFLFCSGSTQVTLSCVFYWAEFLLARPRLQSPSCHSL